MESLIKKISCEIIKSLRGPHSQNWLNQQLDSQNNNIVSKWETSKQRIYWKDFVRCCEIVGAPLSDPLNRHFAISCELSNENEIINTLIPNDEVDKIADFLAISASTMQRLKRGKTPLQLSTFLMLLKYRGELFRFVSRLTNIDSVPSLLKEYNKSRDALRLFAEYPEASPILLLLCFDEYKELTSHIDGWISKKLGITLEKEILIVKKIQSIGLVEFEDGKLIETEHFLNLNYSKQDEKGWSHQIKLNWIKEAKRRFELDDHGQSSRCGFRIFASNEEKEKLINEEVKRFNAKIFQILESGSSGKVDRVRLLTYQLSDIVKS